MTLTRCTENLGLRNGHNVSAAADSECTSSCSDQAHVITLCNHVFHQRCIIKWLYESRECPECSKLCHPRDLKLISRAVAETYKSKK